MNFLDYIWLIPLFPLCGAALMLFLGKRLDPQAPSQVAVAPGLEHTHAGDVHEHGHDHTHSHSHAHGHAHSHGDTHTHADHTHGDAQAHGGHGHGSGLRSLVSLICPGMVLM